MLYGVLGLCILTGFVPSAVAAERYDKPAATNSRYKGRYVSQSVPDPIQITAGETKSVSVTFKNTGTATWNAKGPGYVSVYTIAPKYHDSVFASKDWLRANQPAAITAALKPGASAKVVFTLTAPAQAGQYTEYFALAAEDVTWIQGATFYFKITVLPSKSVSTAPGKDVLPEAVSQAVTAASSTSAAPRVAELLSAAPLLVEAAGGSQITVNLEYRNSGTSTWDGYEWREALTRPLTTSTIGLPLTIADSSWQTGSVISSAATAVEPGESLPLTFTFRTPQKKGKYLVRFALRTEKQVISGAVLEIPVIVTEDVPENYQPATFQTDRALLAPPNIRVGLYVATKPVIFESDFDYEVWSGTTDYGVLPAGEEAALEYKNGGYSFVGGAFNFESSTPLRLVPKDPAAFFTLIGYERRVAGRKPNFNTYRGTAELAFAPASKAVYLINELPLDAYVAGVAETSNDAALEYILAQSVAERSYAYYKLTYSRAAKKMIFDVVPTTADQLYLGYAAEIASPNVAMAAYATAGQFVTYQGAPVVTPYFTRTDGRTRSWNEVWGGPAKPWLVSVRAVYDAGKTMSGHGVGMSGADASRRAQVDKWKYDQILRYYYSGTEVERMY